MRILPAIVVFSAAGAAYLYHQEHKEGRSSLSGLVSSGVEWVSSVSDGLTSENEPEATELPTEPAEAIDLADVFRFDVSPQNVGRTWNRVNNNLRDGGLRGYRVPLVTGSEPDDLAGSLTYYFDTSRARRITFAGSTADPARLVEFLSRQFGFQRVGAQNARVATYSARGSCSGALRISSPGKSSDRFQIDLTIAQ